jgi:hypothetical protein
MIAHDTWPAARIEAGALSAVDGADDASLDF